MARSRVIPVGAITLVGVIGLAGCTAQGGADNSADQGEFVSGGTATIAVSTDPGSLNPLSANASAANSTIWGLAYDTLVVGTTETGEMLPNLAESWEINATTATFDIREGVLCTDGSEVTPSVIAANLDWVLDEANASPWRGAFVPVGATVSANDEEGTLTVESPTPTSFLLENLSYLPIACGEAVDDFSITDSATSGSGMFELTESTPGVSYTFKLRPDYAWGPGEITAQDAGVPESVVVSVVADEATATNLLLAGDVDIAQIGGTDRDRLDAQNYFEIEYLSDPGLIFYNQAEGRPTADIAVREALTQALDRAALGNIATGGRGGALQTIVTGAPLICNPESPIDSFAPRFDAEAAAAALEEAGWEEGADGVREKDGVQLALNVLYPSNRGAGVAATVEAVQEQWAAIGVDVTLTGSDAYAGVLFSGGDWDAVWGPFSTSDPSPWTILLNGPVPPEGRNFSSANNAEYQELTAEAQQEPSAQSCPLWLEAEQALVANLDVVPVMENTRTAYGNKAEFALKNPGAIVGASIRLKN